MKSIAEFVSNGIGSVAELQDALKLAMQLEFSTIPLYLCAQWSVDTSAGGDPDSVARTIRKIVIQEMGHFALAGNILTAIQGAPDIAKPDFVTVYPTHTLPGDIQQELAVDLAPLSNSPDGQSQLDVFLQIEKPEFAPVALLDLQPPATIGAFYSMISDAFDSVQNVVFNPNANSIKSGEATAIANKNDAKQAILRIKQEGEGLEGDPDEPQGAGLDFAHYYKFKEILRGAKLKKTDGNWDFNGDPIHFPRVFDFAASNANPNPSLDFNRILAKLLTELQACWIDGAEFATDTMDELETEGIRLVSTLHVRPQFVWADP